MGQTGNSSVLGNRRNPWLSPNLPCTKHVKIEGQWRYYRAAVGANNKPKPHIIVVDGQEEEHKDGSYCVRHKNTWIDVGNDPIEDSGSAPRCPRRPILNPFLSPPQKEPAEGRQLRYFGMIADAQSIACVEVEF